MKKTNTDTEERAYSDYYRDLAKERVRQSYQNGLIYGFLLGINLTAIVIWLVRHFT